jgi:hypothetical protein
VSHLEHSGILIVAVIGLITLVAIHFRIAKVQVLHCRPTFSLVMEMGKHQFQENYLKSMYFVEIYMLGDFHLT